MSKLTKTTIAANYSKQDNPCSQTMTLSKQAILSDFKNKFRLL